MNNFIDLVKSLKEEKNDVLPLNIIYDLNNLKEILKNNNKIKFFNSLEEYKKDFYSNSNNKIDVIKNIVTSNRDMAKNGIEKLFNIKDFNFSQKGIMKIKENVSILLKDKNIQVINLLNQLINSHNQEQRVLIGKNLNAIISKMLSDEKSKDSLLLLLLWQQIQILDLINNEASSNSLKEDYELVITKWWVFISTYHIAKNIKYIENIENVGKVLPMTKIKVSYNIIFSFYKNNDSWKLDYTDIVKEIMESSNTGKLDLINNFFNQLKLINIKYFVDNSLSWKEILDKVSFFSKKFSKKTIEGKERLNIQKRNSNSFLVKYFLDKENYKTLWEIKEEFVKFLEKLYATY